MVLMSDGRPLVQVLRERRRREQRRAFAHGLFTFTKELAFFAAMFLALAFVFGGVGR